MSQRALQVGRCLLLPVILITSPLHTFAQDVVVDWAAKKVSTPPGTVDKETFATVRIENANDLMFTYSISYQITPLPITDFETIAKAFALAGATPVKLGESATDCDFSPVDTEFKGLADAQLTFKKIPQTTSGCSISKPCDISLQQAQVAWTSTVQPKIITSEAALDKFNHVCTASTFSIAVSLAQSQLMQAKATQEKVLGPNHSVVKVNGIKLSPSGVTKLEVDQLYNGTQTTNGTYSVDLTPTNNRLTLSAGALFSQLQNRTYTSRAIPSATGTGTTNVLSVDGISAFSPSAVALLNYQIPGADWERVGFAVSSGPVLRLGSSSDASSFGYFAGISVHLFHRLYVSPGIHIGQFADFPQGFTSVGQTIPTGIGTPTPVKRWTLRFAIGLTYKAKDFSTLGITGTAKPVTGADATAKPVTAPVKTPDPAPVPSQPSAPPPPV